MDVPVTINEPLVEASEATVKVPLFTRLPLTVKPLPALMVNELLASMVRLPIICVVPELIMGLFVTFGIRT